MVQCGYEKTKGSGLESQVKRKEHEPTSHTQVKYMQNMKCRKLTIPANILFLFH